MRIQAAVTDCLRGRQHCRIDADHSGWHLDLRQKRLRNPVTTTVTAPTYNTVQNQTVSKFLNTGATSVLISTRLSGRCMPVRRPQAPCSKRSSLLRDESIQLLLFNRRQRHKRQYKRAFPHSKNGSLPGGSGSISSGTLDTLTPMAATSLTQSMTSPGDLIWESAANDNHDLHNKLWGR